MLVQHCFIMHVYVNVELFFTLNSIWHYLFVERVTVALLFYPTIRRLGYYSRFSDKTW